ncbi:MAG: hypothetical protein ACRC6A_09620, partial [Fusobacteriaceae bacterium]
ITKAGGNATKTVKSSFERAKLALIAEYLEEINYFSEKKMVIESQLVVKSNEPKTMSQPEQIQIEPILEVGEKRDMGSLLGGLMGNLTVKGIKESSVATKGLLKTENLVVEKSEPIKVVMEEKNINIIKIEEKYEDIVSFKVDLYDYIYDKISEVAVRQIMNFLNIETHYKREIQNYKLEFKFTKGEKSLIFIEKLD